MNCLECMCEVYCKELGIPSIVLVCMEKEREAKANEPDKGTD